MTAPLMAAAAAQTITPPATGAAGWDLAFWLTIAAIVMLLAMSAFFSGSETALTASSRAKLRARADRGDQGAQAALAVVNRDYKPDFFVGGGYMLMPREAGAWTASVGMSWPNAPWSRGRLDAKKAEVTADVDAAAANARVVERQIRLAVHEAHIRATAATQRASGPANHRQ